MGSDGSFCKIKKKLVVGLLSCALVPYALLPPGSSRSILAATG